MVSLMRSRPRHRYTSWDRALDGYSRGGYYAREAGQGSIYPAMDVYETDDSIIAKLVVPGVKPEDISVTLTENVLQIKGSVEVDESVEEGRYLHRERSFGTFSRAVSLPGDVVGSEATAEFENGILTLTVPKAEEVKPKSVKITVKS